MFAGWGAFLKHHWQALLICVVVLVFATAIAGWIEGAIRGIGDSAEAEAPTTDRRPNTYSLLFPMTGARLGVTVDETDEGLVVAEVLPESAADEAGIEEGDRIVRIAGQEVSTRDEARDALATVEGDEFEVELERDGETRTVQVQREAEPSVRRVDPDDRDRFLGRVFPSGPLLGITVETTDDGMRVTGVDSGSGAAEAGLEEGDIIVEADGEPIATVEELRDAVHAHEPGETVELVLQEGTEQRAVSVEVSEAEPFARVPSLGLDVPPWLDGFDFDFSELDDLSAEDLRALRDQLAAAIEEGERRLNEWGDDLLRRIDELIEEATARESGSETAAPDA